LWVLTPFFTVSDASEDDNDIVVSASSTPIDRSASSIDFVSTATTTTATPSDLRSLSSSGVILSPSQVARPSHLPAKSSAEERKHAAEVAKLVQALAQKRERAPV
jgi:hypothetical protein